MPNNPPEGWGDMSYGEREAWRQGAKHRHERNVAACRRLEAGENVRTPDGWVGFVAEKHPEDGRVHVETWDRSGTYGASEVEPVDRGGAGVSL